MNGVEGKSPRLSFYYSDKNHVQSMCEKFAIGHHRSGCLVHIMHLSFVKKVYLCKLVERDWFDHLMKSRLVIGEVGLVKVKS